MKIFGAFLLIIAITYLGTHNSYTAKMVYEKKTIAICKTSILCRMGASIGEEAVVSCMNDNLLPFTQDSFDKCVLSTYAPQ